MVACALVTQRTRARSPVGTSFLGEVFRGFSSSVRQMSGNFTPPRSPNIIWPSSSSILIQYGRQWPDMLTCPKTSNKQTIKLFIVTGWNESIVLSTPISPLQGMISTKSFLSGYIHRNRSLYSKFYVSSFSSFGSALICQSISHSFFLYVCIYIYIYIYILNLFVVTPTLQIYDVVYNVYFILFISTWNCLSLSVSLYLCLSVSLYLCLSVSLYLCLYLSLSLSLSLSPAGYGSSMEMRMDHCVYRGRYSGLTLKPLAIWKD